MAPALPALEWSARAVLQFPQSGGLEDAYEAADACDDL
jgi:hypothetical protein